MKFYLLLFLFLVLQTNALQAQPGGGCDPDIEDCSDEDIEEIPLDDGIILLIAGGIIFSLVKFRTGIFQNAEVDSES